jgi:hypothetical protein
MAARLVFNGGNATSWAPSIISVIAGEVNAVTPDEQINECLEKCC